MTRMRLTLAALISSTLLLVTPAHAQELEQETQLRLVVDAQKRVFEGFRVFVTPELRTVGWDLDRYLLELGMKYKPIDYLSVRGAYRFGIEEKKNGDETQYRFRVDGVGMFPLGDFEPQLRVRYQDSFGPDSVSRQRFRYRARLVYEPIKVFAASVSAEGFQEVETGTLVKMRYAAGVEWVFARSKKKLTQSVALEYAFDYFLEEYTNVYIAQLTYKVVF